ncbi:hypothetical protein [Arsenophonus apicola]|uniref:hypothetical protein n=1 Tax=Arsenophonus apicola TaxID=2879119 RepID=UPI00387924AA
MTEQRERTGEEAEYHLRSQRNQVTYWLKNNQIKISKANEYFEVVIPLLSEKLSTENGEKFPVKYSYV